ncbi:MAG: hypothetical protein ACK4ZU_18585 [Allorhizobium sp.]
MADTERSAAGRGGVRPFVIVAGLLLVMVAFDRIDGISFFGDIDDDLRLLQLKHLMVRGGWYDLTLPMVQSPEIYLSPWSRLIDLPYAVLTLLLQPFLGLDLALVAATQIWPPVMLVVFAALTVRTVQALTPPEALSGPVWLVVGFVLIFAAFEFSPGRIDHHNAQILAMMVILYGLVRDKGRGGRFVGSGAAISLVIGLECLPFVAVALALVAMGFVLRVPFARRVMIATGISMVLVSLVSAIAFIGPVAMLQTACDAYSAPYIAALCGFGACFWISGRLVPEGAAPLPRLLALAVSGAIVVCGLVLLFPSCLNGPYQMIDPVSRFYWFERIQQEQSILEFRQIGQTGAAVLVFLALMALVALFACPFWRRETRGSARHWAGYLFACSSLAMTVLLIRYVRFPAALMPVFLPLALQFCVDTLSNGQGRRARALVIVPAVVVSAVVGGLYALMPYQPSPQDAVWLMSVDDCRSEDFAELNGLAPGRILAPTGIGLALAAHVPDGVSVMAIPFHRAAPGIRLSFTAFAGSYAVARKAALERADYLAVCQVPFPVPFEEAPLYATLVGGKDWPGLVPVAGAEPGRLRIYRIVHDALK